MAKNNLGFMGIKWQLSAWRTQAKNKFLQICNFANFLICKIFQKEMTSPTVRALAVSRQFSMIEAELNENQLDQTNRYGTCK